MESVVTIGNFDGVHAGHRELVRRARARADSSSARVVALVFDPHPSTRLRPDQAPARLTTFDRRAQLLAEAGVDEIVRLDPSDALLSMTPDEFVASVVRERHPVAIVEGPDFNYGKGRAGSIHTLIEEGRRMGFAVEIVQPVEAEISDESTVRVSSTLIRHLISAGRVRDAALLLRRNHEIGGVVTPGDKRGRTIGFPTANIVQQSPPVLLPAQGVYAAHAKLPDGRRLPAAVNIGARPTFDAPEPRIEVHIIDPASMSPARAIPDYGWHCTIEIAAFVRDTVRFDGIDSLRAQLERDRAAAVRLLDFSPGPPMPDHHAATIAPGAAVPARS
ncbi:MAG: riboflavin biosynthesis protein RibF [Phycisphaerales bacterium]|nr:riboflavin biosynthesis protein RibF [Planctomycetota bacterium]